MVLAGCGSGSGTGPAAASRSGTTAATSSETMTGTGRTAGSNPAAAGGEVVLITHDSFGVDKKTLADFEAQSGIKVKLLAQGDAGAMVNILVLTKQNPLGDAVFGVDNTFASRALDAGILQPYRSPLAAQGSVRYSVNRDNRLSAVDFGDVCVNVDHGYFAAKKIAEPRTFEDLALPAYKNLLEVESPATSSPGLAFLLGTIAHFGESGWQHYWTALRGNGVKVAASWEDAYTVDFSGSTGKGSRPLVVSYASSPPSEVPKGAAAAPTGALLDTCFRQVEYAGVLTGAKNPAAAHKVVDFLLSKAFQAGVAGQMYVYPVDPAVALPADWQKFAPIAPKPATLPAEQIAGHREAWITAWTDLLQG